MLIKIGAKYSKSPAQILIRWSLQKGYIVLPKSSHKDRIEQNADVFDFDLADGDMSVLDSFNSDYVSGECIRFDNLVSRSHDPSSIQKKRGVCGGRGANDHIFQANPTSPTTRYMRSFPWMT